MRGLALGLTMLLAPFTASAAEISWWAGSGGWSNAGNWWPNQLPGAGDIAWVRAPAGETIWVTYSHAAPPLLDVAHFDSVGSGQAIVLVSQDLLHVGQQNVGVWGRGAMAVNGTGSHYVGDLNLGFWGGSEGTYSLNGDATLLANQVMVGLGGNGTMRQLGGTATLSGDLNVGFFGGTVGSYELHPTASLSARTIFVGNGGHGTFTHTGAAYSVTGDVTIANLNGSWGRYELGGGGSIAANRVFIGAGGVGALIQDDGSINVAGDTILAFWGSGNATWALSGTSTHENRTLFVGGGGRGVMTVNGGATSTSRVDTVVGNLRGSNGRIDLVDGALVTWRNFFVGGDSIGRVTQSAGTNGIGADLIVGNLGAGNGTYELLGGALSSNRAYIGSFGDGHVDHSGGTNDVNGLMQIGVWGGGLGSYALSGTGSLEVGTLVLGGFGVGYFTQTGGDATVVGQVRIAELNNSFSVLRIEGGTFDAATIWNKIHGRIVYTGGALGTGYLTNNGVLELGGAGLRVVDTPLTNTGRVEATETAVEYTGAFAHQGDYLSVDTASTFVDMVVTQQGTVVADADSVLAFTGDLRLDAAGAGWDTALARLEFLTSGDGVHTLHHPGQDLGAVIEGYTDNYAWGGLSLASGESLLVTGGTLYVGALELEDGLPQLTSISSNGRNIYYDAEAPENGYLGGTTHALTGGGEAIPVPEPGMLAGLVAGMLMLSRLPRKGARR